MTEIGSHPQSELNRLVQQAIDHVANTRYTFTEDEALRPVWEAGYEVTADSDPRFVLTQEADGSHPRQWRLAVQAPANDRLLDALRACTWNGQDIEAELQHLDTKDGVHSIFCLTDSRFRRRQDGAWESAEEVEAPLPEEIKTDLDALGPGLLQAWTEEGAEPWTVRRVTEVLNGLGWPEASEGRNWLCVQSWLRGCPSVLRVGVDYWVPAGSVPGVPKRRVLAIVPLPRSQPAVPDACAEDGYYPRTPGTRETQQEDVALIPFIEPGASGASTHWVVTLRTINVVEGFLTVPAHARWVYPSRATGAGPIEVLRGTWFDTGEDVWLWLDRADNCLYGPHLANQLAWCSAGERIHIDWAADVIVLRTTGIDAQVQEEEARLADPDALRALRGGIGETYRESVVAILAEVSQGLTFSEVVSALRARQHHAVHRGTIRALLSAGGFVQHGNRWFVAPDAEDGTRRLRLAIARTYLPPDVRQDDPGVLVRAMRSRLHEIVETLRRPNVAE